MNRIFTIFYKLLILCFVFIAFPALARSKVIHMPDPDVNNKTLLGVDVDKNGIRDDVQIWIYQKYKHSPELLNAFYRYAFSIQKTFEKKDHRNESNLASHKELKVQQCIIQLLHERKIPFSRISESTSQVRALLTNTKLRIQAMEKVNQNFHGQSGTVLSKDEACE